MLDDLELTPLEERRKHLRLNMFFKIVDRSIPALPPDNFLTPAPSNRRRIKPTHYEGFITNNILDRHVVNHSRGFVVPDAETDQFWNSFFVRTVTQWNGLNESAATAGSVSAFKLALTGEPAST